MKEILLTQGMVAFVDDEDFEELNKFTWCAMKIKNTFYAARSIHIAGAGNKSIHPYMHRILLTPTKDRQIDHINGNGLDNRRENLRVVTSRQNSQNRHTPKSSKYPGVSFNKSISKWRVMLRWNRKNRYLGDYKNEVDAATVYRVACAVLVDGN
jgi:hypothetical protein